MEIASSLETSSGVRNDENAVRTDPPPLTNSQVSSILITTEQRLKTRRKNAYCNTGRF